MQCENCNTEISSKMRAALHKNECPFCGHEIMEAKRAKQYASLVEILERVQLTNKEELDSKIKEKVVQVLVDNFVFSQIKAKAKEADVVVVEEDEEVEEELEEELEEIVPEQPARSLAAAKGRTQATRAKAGVPTNAMSMYHEAQSELYESAQNDPAFESDVDEDEADASKYFQETLSPDIRRKVEERLSKARANVSTTGGIRKLR